MKNKMRSMGIIALTAVIVFTMASCGGSSPSSVARNFYTAVEKGDTKAIEQNSTPETAQLMALFGEKAKEGLTENAKIKSTSEKIDGDTAVVTLTFDNGETQELDLIKVNGKWKVTISK